MGSSDVCAYTGCGRKRLSDTDLCIFHAPAEKKDPHEFEDELGALLRDCFTLTRATDFNFGGFVFTFHSDNIQVFRGVHFDRLVLFQGAIFSQRADFTQTVFGAQAIFNDAVFHRAAIFDEAHFEGDAYFGGARFCEGLWMGRATFKANSNFDFCHLHKSMLLDGTSFANLGLFYGCEIHGHVSVRWPGEEDRRGPDGKILPFGRMTVTDPRFASRSDVLDLMKNLLRERDQLTIKSVHAHGEMGHILLEGTDCTKIRFYDCEWPRLRGRFVVGDEYRARKWKRNLFAGFRLQLRHAIRRKRNLRKRLHVRKEPAPWHLIEETYEQLARRFHEDFKHALGNDFDRGVFATRLLSTQGQTWLGTKLWPIALRPQKDTVGRGARWILCSTLKGLKRFCSLGALFRYTSFYGGSVVLPFVWLLAMTALLAGLYDKFLYDGCWTLHNWVWPSKGFTAALRIAGLNRTWLVDTLKDSPHELLVTALATAQVVVTAILITLLIFAVRRRFKHGD